MNTMFDDNEPKQPEQSEQAAKVEPAVEPAAKPAVQPVMKVSPSKQLVTDVGNEFFVSASNHGISVAGAPRGSLSYERALVFAAWIVALAQPFASVQFEDVLRDVQNT